MKKAWLIWLSASLLLGLYLGAGSLSSSYNSVALKLEAGSTAKLQVLRVMSDNLQLELVFQGDRRREELGKWNSSEDWRVTGLLKFNSAGATVRITATAPNAGPVMYEAMPASRFASGTVGRRLTSDLSIDPGIWRWPPRSKNLALHPGFNDLSLDVVSVDSLFAGETVTAKVIPPLRFDVITSNTKWLWLWFFWPGIVAIQLIWAAILAFKSLKRSSA